MSLRIGFDIDGVLADFRSAFSQTAERILNRRVTDAVGPEQTPSALSPDDVRRVWEHIGEDAELVDGSAGLRAGADRQAVRADARHGVGSRLHDQAPRERRGLGAVPDAVVDRTVWVLLAGGRYGAGLARRRANAAAARHRRRRSADQLRRGHRGGSTKAVLMLRRRLTRRPGSGDGARRRRRQHARRAIDRPGAAAFEEVKRAKRGPAVRLADWFKPAVEAHTLPDNPRAVRPIPPFSAKDKGRG